MTRCVSTCQKKSLDNCKSNSKCIYVNGKTRKYCRLSYKYKMNKLSCNVTKKITRKQAATRIQTLFRKNKTKKIQNKQNNNSMSSAITPRKKYYNKYFDKPVTLLGKKDFFQVSFSNPNQFNKYAQITDKPKIECFIQTLFSLGLRDRKEGKKDIEKLEQYKIGILSTEATKYIENSFGLKKGQVNFRIFNNVFTNNNEFKYDISYNLQENLENNYATIIYLEYTKGSRKWGHYIVAYKYKDKILYFDPQDKTHTKHTHKLSLEGVIVSRYGYFKMKNVRKSVEIKNNTCSMEFLGGE